MAVVVNIGGEPYKLTRFIWLTPGVHNDGHCALKIILILYYNIDGV